MYINGAPDIRFWAKVDKSDECWTWIAGKTQGYGKFRAGGAGSKTVLAHRWAWEQERGPIPDGLELDHLCRNRACVRPTHLEAVTPSVNKARQDQKKPLRPTCKWGHAWTPDNTLMRKDGRGRICLTCEPRRRR